jgi:hypothetical protein
MVLEKDDVESLKEINNDWALNAIHEPSQMIWKRIVVPVCDQEGWSILTCDILASPNTPMVLEFRHFDSSKNGKSKIAHSAHLVAERVKEVRELLTLLNSLPLS